MIFYDKIIEETKRLVEGDMIFGYAEDEVCRIGDRGDLILSSETAFEFGGSALPAVSLTLFCSDSDIKDEVVIMGNDIEKTASDTPYARIAVISLDETKLPGKDDIYKALKDIEFARYRFYPKDCLLRVSSESRREQLRISKKAVSDGLSLKNIGFGLIDAYKKNNAVKAVKIIFITKKDFDYKELRLLSEKANKITQSLNKIMDGLEVSCNTCEMKALCDEVEGMKQLHFKKEKKSDV